MNRDRSRKSRRQSKAGPLTPAKTPTSDAFEPTTTLAPITFEANFHDSRVAWDTTNPSSASPQELTTPKSEVLDDQSAGYQSNQKSDIDAELASHVHHPSSNPHLTLPPVEPARQLSSSPGPGSAKRTRLDGSLIERNGQEVQHPAVRTPAKKVPRRRLPSKETEWATLSSMAADQRDSRRSASNASRMGPPETPGQRVAASPPFFPSLQFSPDMFQTPMSGPATAPAYPQNRLFWDPSSNPEDVAYQDPFGPSHPDLVSPFTPSPVPSHGFQSTGSVSGHHSYDLPSSQSTQVLAPPISPSVDPNGFPAGFTASPRVPVPAPEDPSMFLSSPARRFGPVSQPLGAFSSNGRPELQAYHHQIRESRREEEMEKSKKSISKKSSSARKSKNVLKRPASPAAADRLGLKHTPAHGEAGDVEPHRRRPSQVSFADSVSVVDDGAFRPRGGRSSPQQFGSIVPCTSSDRPQSRSRPSLSFTIDRDGRAKTVITQVPDRPTSRMDLDDESSGSEGGSPDAADFDIARSQNNSFAFPEQEEPSRPIERLRYEFISHSKSSSRSSTIASSASAHPSSRTSSIQGGPRGRPRLSVDPYSKHMPDAQARRSFTSFHPPAPHHYEGTEEEESGNAQHALRAMLKDRPRSVSSHIGHFPPDPPSQLSNAFQPFHSSPPMVPHHSTYGIFKASPTTVTDPDLATPSTDHGSHASSGSTRCVCNSSSPDGHLMIQCESCSKWLHATCVGIDSHEVPPVYICVYCAQTPMRHGRVREPSRAAAMAPLSPLAHKRGRQGR